MTTEAANKLKYALATKKVDFSADAFKIILMATGFTFNKDTHHAYEDVSASELANAHGYTTGGNTLAGVAVTEDDTDDRTEVTWDNTQWTASGGAIGPSPGAIIFDDQSAVAAEKYVVGYIDFGGDQTQADGGVATISNIEVRIA